MSNAKYNLVYEPWRVIHKNFSFLKYYSLGAKNEYALEAIGVSFTEFNRMFLNK